MATDFSSGNINAYLVKDEYNQYAVRIETDVKSLDTVKGINRSRRCTFSPRITWYIPEDLHYSKNVSNQVIESVLERELLKPGVKQTIPQKNFTKKDVIDYIKNTEIGTTKPY